MQLNRIGDRRGRGRPRLFDERELAHLDDAGRRQIYEAGLAAGYSPGVMAGVVGWLVTQRELDRATAAKYRRLLAELHTDGNGHGPPRLRAWCYLAGGLAGGAVTELVDRADAHANARQLLRLVAAAATASPGTASAVRALAAPIIHVMSL